MRSTRWTAWAFTAITLPAAAGAQRLIELPVHTTATAEAAVSGVSALFWNPAGLSAGSYRGAAMVMNLVTPTAVGVSGIIGGGVYRSDRLTLGAAWEHVGIDNIPMTEESPTEAGQFSLGEDHFTVAAAHALRPGVQVGATAHYIRDDLDGSSAVLALGAGAQAQIKFPWSTTVGAFVLNEGDEVVWSAGIDAGLPPVFGPSYHVHVSYGAGRDAHSAEIDHRIAAGIDLLERATVSAGVTRQTGAGTSSWQPLLAASLRLNRYTLGVARESLAEDFGATYSFRLQVGIGR